MKDRNNYPIWWIKTMQYLRTVSGTVYSDQLIAYTRKMMCNYGEKDILPKNVDIVDYLNSFSTEIIKRDFIKTHTLTGEIYTVPYMRTVLDSLIYKNDPEYIYNKYLYIDTFDRSAVKADVRSCTPDFLDTILSFDEKRNAVAIDFSRAKTGTELYVTDFSIEKAYSYALQKYRTDSLCISRIIADSVIFLGDTGIGFSNEFDTIPVINEYCDFQCSVFEKDVVIQNLIFLLNSNLQTGCSELLNFRNSRFFGDVRLRNIRFGNTSVDNKLSFEDARIAGNLEITNTDFEHVGLYCFQTIFGYFLMQDKEAPEQRSIILNNLRFAEDTKIDFVDVELDHGSVKIHNISLLPTMDLCFSAKEKNAVKYCPDIFVAFKNCNINNNLNISNISELIFQKTRNFGRIIADENWSDVDTAEWAKIHKEKYKKKSLGPGRTVINNKALLAVYNCCAYYNDKNKHVTSFYKAKSFIILKENFSAQGLYDDEDTAFILYMEFKPYIDSYNKCGELSKVRARKRTALLYRILYISGKYGVSPTRIIKVLTVTVIVFTLLFFLVSLFSSEDAFSIGKVMLSKGSKINIAFANLFGVDTGKAYKDFIGSFLYSLESIVPFISQFEPFNIVIILLSAIENFIGTFLIGYFSVAVIRKTLR